MSRVSAANFSVWLEVCLLLAESLLVLCLLFSSQHVGSDNHAMRRG